MASRLIFPVHAYIPGITERHPEGTFDHIRDTIDGCLSPRELANSTAFLSGISYIDAGFYWEAHEVLEPVWLALPGGSEERVFVQALIQLANAHLKLTMGRPKAADRLCEIVRDLLRQTESPVIMTMKTEDVIKDLNSLERRIKHVL